MLVAHEASAQASRGLIWQVSSDRFSDPLPLSALMRNELAEVKPRHEQSLIYLRDEARLSARWAAGTLSVIARQSATLVADRGAAVVVQDIATAGKPATSYRHPVNLYVQGFAGVGLGFDLAGATGKGVLAWQVGVQGLRLTRHLMRELNGLAIYDAGTGVYELDAASRQANDRLRFPFQRAHAASGSAWLFHGGLGWQASDSLRLGLRVEDLGRLRWDDIPRESLTLSTDVSSVDSDGYLVYKPLVSGRNLQTAYTTKATASWEASGQWTWSSTWQGVWRVRRVDGFHPALHETGMSWAHAGWRATAGWRWHERALDLGISKGGLTLRMSADRLDASAHTRMLALQWASDW